MGVSCSGMIRPLIFLLFVIIPGLAQSYKCLPADVKPDVVVSADRVPTGTGQGKFEKITVSQTLNKMHARCSGTRFVIQAIEAIRFYRRKGCWGNPPEDHAEILQRQREELDSLKKKYTVVEITCNPSGLQVPTQRDQ